MSSTASKPPGGSLKKDGKSQRVVGNSRVKVMGSSMASSALKSNKATAGSRYGGGEKLQSSGNKNIGKLSTRASRRMRSSRSGSRHGGKKGKGGKDDAARIIDKLGRDVTPKSLSSSTTKSGQGDLESSNLALAGVSMKSGNMSDSQDDLGSITESLGSRAPLAAAASSTEAGDKKVAEPEQPVEEVIKVPEKRKLTEAELKQQVQIKITESETFDILHLPGMRVWGEDEALHDQVKAKNEKYEAMLLKQKAEKDKFSARHAQSFNNSLRHKEIQASPPETTEAGVQITTWAIYDANLEQGPAQEAMLNNLLGAGKELAVTGAAGGGAAPGPHTSLASMPHTSVASMDASTFIAKEGSSYAGKKPQSMGSGVLAPTNDFSTISKMPSFKNALDVLEQAVIQNEIREKQLLYRADEVAASGSEAAGGEASADGKVEGGGLEFSEARRDPPALTHLWSYTCPGLEDLPVSCMCFNQQNHDLLVAGYGRAEFGNTNAGTILFWSLKNPTYPTKRINTKHSVTSIDFCTEYPHLLAVGLYDGSVAIYDIRDNTDKPALQSAHATGKHSEPVWGVKWVTKESTKRAQQLCSISTDGSVQQWSMKKGLVPKELMQLKRVPNKVQFQGSQMEGISREASGLCFDFPINDGTQYLAGTEDGLLHKCSVSYNEQTLESYYGHTGPVYKVRTSPYLADAFLSCSADWTCSLWSQKATSPVLTFQSGHDYVMDIQWAPSNSCVFGSVSRDGRVEVWDLESSPLDPVIKHKVEDSTLSTVLFSPNSPVILTGDNNGVIEVYRMTGVCEFTNASTEKQAGRLNEAMYANNNETKNPRPKDD